jgi:hypothetical protein
MSTVPLASLNCDSNGILLMNAAVKIPTRVSPVSDNENTMFFNNSQWPNR